MQTPLQVTFHQMPTSAAVENDVRSWTDQLEEVFDRITSCQVLIELPHRHQQQGRLFHVRIDLHVPGKHIVAGRSPDQDRSHENVHAAIRDAFEAAQRQLVDYVARHRGATNIHTHSEPPLP